MMTLLALAAPDKFEMSGKALLEVFGNLHPAVVHFPIALVTLAALLEAWQVLRKRAEPAAATRLCVILGALFSIPSVLFGWFLEEAKGVEGELFDLHKWIGIAAGVVAIVAAGAALKPGCCKASLAVLRGGVFLGAALVGATGYLGGDLVFGKNHILRPLWVKEKSSPPTHVAVDPPKDPVKDPSKDPLLKPGKPDFAKEVAPALSKLCLRCHGGEKVKGKLNIKTKAGFLKGGEGGKCVTPGKPDASTFYTCMFDADEEVRMSPPKEKVQPTKEELDLIKRWIEGGADWPEGVELK